MIEVRTIKRGREWNGEIFNGDNILAAERYGLVHARAWAMGARAALAGEKRKSPYKNGWSLAHRGFSNVWRDGYDAAMKLKVTP